MPEQQFPVGWNEARVRKLIEELDARTDDEWTATDDSAASQSETNPPQPPSPRRSESGG